MVVGVQWSLEIRAEGDAEVGVGEGFRNFLPALGMARNDHRQGVGIGFADGGSDEGFLSRKSGGSKHDGSVFPKRGQHFREIAAWGGRSGELGVELDTTGEVDVFWRDSEFYPKVPMNFLLDADAGEFGEKGSDDGGEEAEAFGGAWGDAGVGEGDGDVVFGGEEKQVRPGFAFDQDDF